MEKLASYEFPSPRGKYPWKQWENGEVWRVNPEQFAVTAKQLRQSLAQRASRSKVRIQSTAEVDGMVVFKFHTNGS